jgi:hypothetical protein
VDDIRGAERGCHFTYRCDGPGSPYNRANGYSYNAEKIFLRQERQGDAGAVPRVRPCTAWPLAADSRSASAPTCVSSLPMRNCRSWRSSGAWSRHGRRRADAQASARRRDARTDLLRAHLQRSGSLGARPHDTGLRSPRGEALNSRKRWPARASMRSARPSGSSPWPPRTISAIPLAETDRTDEADWITQSSRGGTSEFGEARASVRRMTRCRYLTNLCY